MNMRIQLFALFTLALSASVCWAQLSVVNTQRIGNTVRLECREGGIAVRGAMFWRNEPSDSNELRALMDPQVQILNRNTADQDDYITFIITRELEGTIYCGSDLVSRSTQGLLLVAYPDQNSLQTFDPVTEFFAKEGTTARLNCSVLPGVLRDQYYADWLNSTSTIQVARVEGQRNLPDALFDTRFSVSEETFSLSIDEVRLTDAGLYRCVVGVQDPAGQAFTFTQTETLNLRLTVYNAPLITQPPQEQIIALRNNVQQNATFRCEARGQPQPTIQWLHNSDFVENSRSNGKYFVRSYLRPTQTGDFIVTSVLTINNLNAFDSGEVKCIVEVSDSSFPEEIQLTKATARLAIIGAVNSLNLLVTMNRDIVFKLQLPSKILVPVQLYIRYIDAKDPTRMMSQVTRNFYNDTSFITHFEPRAFVPADFRRVRIMVALQYQDMKGPMNISADKYNLQTPTLFTEEEASVQRAKIISITCSVTVIAFLLAIFIPVIATIACRQVYKRKKVNYKAQIAESKAELASQKADHEQETIELKQNNEASLKELQENHRLELEKLRTDNETELQRFRLEQEKELEMLKERNRHEEQKMLFINIMEVFRETCQNSRRNGMQVKLEHGSSVLTFEMGSNDQADGVDMIDGGECHTHYQAHSKRRLMLTRGETIDYDSCGSNSDQDLEYVRDCFKSIFRAGINDSLLGPELRSVMSTKE